MPDSIIKADNISSLSGGGIGFPDGNSSNPSMKFTNDSDTGLYRIGSNTIGISSGGVKVGEIGSGYGAFTGNVVQCRVTRYDGQATASTGTGVDGIELTVMRTSITPKFSTSMILCQFQIHSEISTNDWDAMFTVYRNGVVPTGTYAGFNTTVGNALWSGLSMTNPYDSSNNVDSTPFTSSFIYHDFPSTTNTLTYAPGIKTSNAGTIKTIYLNRTYTSTGTTSYEAGVCFSTVWEIAQ